MDLVVKGVRITTPIETILRRIQKDTNFNYLKDIKKSGSSVLITCPIHKNHSENHPSCGVCDYNQRYRPGGFHCFSCGATGTIEELVNICFNRGRNSTFGEQWIVDNFGYELIETPVELEPIKLNTVFAVDDSCLSSFQYGDNPATEYLVNKRHISKDIIDRFHIGYDPSDNSVVFPVYHPNDRFLMVTKRSLTEHRFRLPSSEEKPVYLLNEVIKNNITQVIVCESQINALTCWSYGYPAIALFGTGSQQQYEILNKCGIRSFILMFDGDDAGRKGAQRFIANVGKHSLITDVVMPQGMDVNDTSYEQFISLINKNLTSN